MFKQVQAVSPQTQTEIVGYQARIPSQQRNPSNPIPQSKVAARFELANGGFAGPCLTTWLRHQPFPDFMQPLAGLAPQQTLWELTPSGDA